MEIYGVGARADGKDIHKFDLIEDVEYIKVRNKIPVFHTTKGVFYQVVTLKQLEAWLYPHGFRKLDKTNLVNIAKITKVDYENRMVYFENGSYTTVSIYKLPELKKMLEERGDIL